MSRDVNNATKCVKSVSAMWNAFENHVKMKIILCSYLFPNIFIFASPPRTKQHIEHFLFPYVLMYFHVYFNIFPCISMYVRVFSCILCRCSYIFICFVTFCYRILIHASSTLLHASAPRWFLSLAAGFFRIFRHLWYFVTISARVSNEQLSGYILHAQGEGFRFFLLTAIG